MIITTKQQASHVEKPEGTKVDYYLFDEYEVHNNKQAPHTTQTWHHHEILWESLLVIEGELTAQWREGDTDKSQIVRAGDFIESEDTPHTFTNHTDKVTKFIVIKQVLSGKKHRDIFKTDKVLD